MGSGPRVRVWVYVEGYEEATCSLFPTLSSVYFSVSIATGLSSLKDKKENFLLNHLCVELLSLSPHKNEDDRYAFDPSQILCSPDTVSALSPP